MAVVDGKTGKPITGFFYAARYREPGRIIERKIEWRRLDTPTGEFVVQAPPTCLLAVRIDCRDVPADSIPYHHEFAIRATERERRGTVRLEPGVTVHGTVRDASTGQPIAGATITQKAHYGYHSGAPLPGPEVREAKSDNDGHYELRGLNAHSGILAFHPDYGGIDHGVDVDKGEGSRFDVTLTPVDKPTFRGTVRDANGRPLDGVTVSAGAKNVLTAADGTYALQLVVGQPGHHVLPVLTYSKEGYVTQQFAEKEVGAEGLQVILERQVPLEGRVLDPNGQPVKRYEVIALSAGTRLGHASLKGLERVVADTAGSFKVWLDREGTTWASVRARGYENWEMVTDVPRGGCHLDVRLTPGVSVTAKVLGPPGGLAGIVARLAPRWDLSDGRGPGSDSQVVEWLTRTTTVAADGTLNLDHVRPDRYTLLLKGPGVTSTLLAVDVPRGGLDLGQIRLSGVGRVDGRAFKSSEGEGVGRQFAFGRIRFSPVTRPFTQYDETFEFMTDDEGRFSLEGVPVGLVELAFPEMPTYPVVIDSHDVEVCENQTTEVRLFGPKARWPVAVEIIIGDGSEGQSRSGKGLPVKAKTGAAIAPPAKAVRAPALPRRDGDGEISLLDSERARASRSFDDRYQVQLIPRARQPLSAVRSDWERIDRKGQILLPDVRPGFYTLRVLQDNRQAVGRLWGSGSVVYEGDVKVPDGPFSIKVPLGGGSITGNFGEYDEIFALAQGRQSPIHRFRFDVGELNCVPFLDPGTYTLFAHSNDGFWCRVDNVTVGTDVRDVGQHNLVRGGTIRGSISFRRPCPVPDEVIASGPSQITLAPIDRFRSFDQFEIRGLWPGRWTITVRGGRAVLATAFAEITGIETVSLALEAQPEKRP